ncbi:hypothetical protein BDD12DRAFT_809069 [Trichophaea hybrida]|nr:hypothetical protein BDD12DRAFT_809069 [Trichophaea hybrida]
MLEHDMNTKREIDLRISPEFLQRVADRIINEDLSKEEAFEKELSVGEEQPTGRISDNDLRHKPSTFHQSVTQIWVRNSIDFPDVVVVNVNHSAPSTRAGHSIDAIVDSQDMHYFAKPDILQITPIPTNALSQAERLPPNFRYKPPTSQ